MSKEPQESNRKEIIKTIRNSSVIMTWKHVNLKGGMIFPMKKSEINMT